VPALPQWMVGAAPVVPQEYMVDVLAIRKAYPYGFASRKIAVPEIISTLRCTEYRGRIIRRIIMEPYRYGVPDVPSLGGRGVTIDADELPPERSIEDLIADRMRSSRRGHAKAKKHERTLTLPAEPFGIMVFGDPHVDGHCDWDKLYADVQLAKGTPGVVACSVGDQMDNWIGRLARLYADSDCKASDGWRLSEWMFNEVSFIAVVGGNHDAWATGPGIDPMAWLTRDCGVTCYAPDELRITLQWKDRSDLDPIIWICRHDFKGRSWYHPTHGPHKEATLDGKCHLLTCGHIHQWGQLTTEQRHGRVTHAIRVKGYKRDDEFARSKGFPEQQHGHSALVVIDPEASEPGRVSVFWNLQKGCDYLTKLRD
jgi:hypothetical protein